MQNLKNLWARAVIAWSNLGPVYKDAVILIAAFAILFLTIASASAQTAPNATSTFQTGHTGFWMEEGQTGSGVALTVDQNGLIGAALFTFSPTTVPQLLPGLQSGDWIEGANHVYLVGAAPSSQGQFSVSVPLNLPVFGDGFMGLAEQSVTFGELVLTVVSCDRIDYAASINTGFPTGAPGVVQTAASGRLKRVTSGGGTCALDCTYPNFGPFPAQCPAR